MFVAPDFGQYALLILFVPAAVAMVLGLLLVRRARGAAGRSGSRALGGTGLGLGLFGLLVILSAFAEMVRRDPTLLLPYSMRPGSPTWRSTQIFPPSAAVMPPTLWEARAALHLDATPLAPQDPAADPSPADLPFDPEIRIHSRLLQNAALLLRAGEIAADPKGGSSTWMSLEAARKLLGAARDPILRSERVREHYEREIVGAARIEGEGPVGPRFSVVAACATPARAVAIATALAGALVDSDAEAIRLAIRLQRQRAVAAVERLERQRDSEVARLAAWRQEPNFAPELPRVETRIRELERDLEDARRALERAEALLPPTHPRLRILRYPTHAEPTAR